MRRSNHKYLFCCILASLFGGVILFSISGCSDNPEAKSAKTVRQQTAEAVEVATRDGDLAGAQRKITNALTRNRTSGLTNDSALLVSGNLALVQGQQMQAEMSLKALPIQGSADAMESLLRRSESLLVEKERIDSLLARGDQEIVELQQVLDGPDGVVKQLADANGRMMDLLAQKQTLQDKKDDTQATLDDYQNQADELMRKAEMTQADQKLQLQNQAFDILKKRKNYYIDAQAAENQINVLDRNVELEQLTVNNLTAGVSQAEKRIQDIENSETRAMLNQQMGDIEQTIARNQQSLVSSAAEIKAGLNDYKQFFLGQSSDKTSAIGFFEEAVSEFSKIRSGDAGFVAQLRLAESNYHAALVCSAYADFQQDLSARFQDLMDFSDPAFSQVLADKLPIQVIDNELMEKTLGFYDQALEAYDKAKDRAGRIGADAKCSVLKSKLMAAHNKMIFADAIQNGDLANEIETMIEELKAEGAELGVCFTQSEALKVVEMGIDYMPSLPMNMAVLAEGLKVNFQAWKRLPLTEQEAQIDRNIIEIDELVNQYGQDLGEHLLPLKQEMLSAKERGFEATATRPTGGFDPNSM